MFPQVTPFFTSLPTQQPLFNTWRPTVPNTRPSAIIQPTVKPSMAQQEPIVIETRKSHIEEVNVKRESAIMSSRSKVGMSEVPRRSFTGHDHFFKYRRKSGESEVPVDLVSIDDVEELRKKATSLRYRVAKLKLEKERDERIIGNLVDFLTSFREGKLLIEQLRFENHIAC